MNGETMKLEENKNDDDKKKKGCCWIEWERNKSNRPVYFHYKIIFIYYIKKKL